MENENVLSIIVPVYNTERYLPDCIESIIKQTCKNLEIIIVDDGSSDGSGMICDQYKDQDNRIKVFHQVNRGRVAARKNGLDNATGKYVIFIDSDDWIEENMCEEMLFLAHRHHADMVTSGYTREEAGREIRITDTFAEGLYASEEEREKLLVNSMIYKNTDLAGMSFSLCMKLYRREIARKVMELIPDKLRRGEDFVFNNLYLLNCRTVYISKNIYYHYRNHSSSTVNSPTPDFMEQVGMAQAALRNELLKSDLKDVLIKNLNNRIFLHFVRMWNIEMEKESDIHIPIYCFDFGKIQADRVVLYGAGKVGIDYYLQFLKTFPSKLVLWVDKNYENIRTERYRVSSVESLASAEYDRILIAIESEQTALEIKKELTETFGIQERKILWQKPDHYWI